MVTILKYVWNEADKRSKIASVWCLSQLLLKDATALANVAVLSNRVRKESHEKEISSEQGKVAAKEGVVLQVEV